MTAFGKAVGAPGTTGADALTQSSGPGSSGPALSADAMAQAAQGAPAAPLDVNAVFRRSPVPPPRPRPNVPQRPTPGVVEQRWPGLENPDTSTLLQDIAGVPSPSNAVTMSPDWSRLPHGIASVPSPGRSQPGLPQPGVENPDARTLLQGIAAVPPPPKLSLPVLEKNHIDPDDLVRRIVRAESSGNPNAKNASSTATGLAQFKDDTWVEQVRKYRPDLAAWWQSDDALKLLRADPSLQQEMAARYAEENARALQRAKFPVNDRNLYLAHHFGAKGATDLLTADAVDPNKLAGDAVPWAMKANHWITSTMTTHDLLRWIQDRIQNGPR